MNLARYAVRRLRGTPVYPRLEAARDLSPSRRAERRRRVAFYRQFVPTGGLVFDVGANLGNRVQAFLDLGATVVAVEPQDFCVQTLKARWARSHRLTILPIALSDSVGQLSMFQASSHTLTTFSQTYAARTDHGGTTFVRGPVVRVATMQHLVDIFGVPDFVKIDVEGFEHNVLRGLLTPVPVLSFEANVHMLDVAFECLEVLERLGNYRYAWSSGEQLRLEGDWRTAAEMRTTLQSSSEFGDVYARLH